jgi:hypothetical protein
MSSSFLAIGRLGARNDILIDEIIFTEISGNYSIVQDMAELLGGFRLRAVRDRSPIATAPELPSGNIGVTAALAPAPA